MTYRKRTLTETSCQAPRVNDPDRVRCINSARPAEYASLQGESSSRSARGRGPHTPAAGRPVRAKSHSQPRFVASETGPKVGRTPDRASLDTTCLASVLARARDPLPRKVFICSGIEFTHPTRF